MQLSSARLFSTRTAMSVTILSREAVRAAADISLPPDHSITCRYIIFKSRNTPSIYDIQPIKYGIKKI
jgi:hypothetical protein